MLQVAPPSLCPDGGTGRRAGLKIRFSQESGSSTLPPGTMVSPLDLFLVVAYHPPPSVMKIKRIHGSSIVLSCCPSFTLFSNSPRRQHTRKVLALGAAILFVGSVSVAVAQERLQSNQSGMGVGEGVGDVSGNSTRVNVF